MEFSLCTLTPEVQCLTFHQNHVVWQTKIKSFWRNGNDSKQPYCRSIISTSSTHFFMLQNLSVCKIKVFVTFGTMVWFSEWIQLSIFLFFLFFLLFFLCCCQLQRVSEWLLINANSAIFQLYHGKQLQRQFTFIIQIISLWINNFFSILLVLQSYRDHSLSVTCDRSVVFSGY